MDENPNENRKPRRKLKYLPNLERGRARAHAAKAEEARRLEEEAKKSGNKIQPRLHLEGNAANLQPKVENQSSVQVAFPVGSSLSPRTLGCGNAKSSGSGSIVSDIVDESVTGYTTDEDYKEPWNSNSNHPIVLPMRMPNSGNPDILNEQEFGEAATNVEYDGECQNPTGKLEFLESSEPKMIFLQLPSILPSVMQKASRTGKEKIDSSKESEELKMEPNLSEIPSGFMGKLQVYKSGKVKLKIGENLFDVNPSVQTQFAQDVVAINAENKEFAVIGPVTETVAVTPDVDSILESLKKVGS